DLNLDAERRSNNLGRHQCATQWRRDDAGGLDAVGHKPFGGFISFVDALLIKLEVFPTTKLVMGVGSCCPMPNSIANYTVTEKCIFPESHGLLTSAEVHIFRHFFISCWFVTYLRHYPKIQRCCLNPA